MKRANSNGVIKLTGRAYNAMVEEIERLRAGAIQLDRGHMGLQGVPAGCIVATSAAELTIGQVVGLSGADFTTTTDQGAFVIRNHTVATPTLVAANHKMNSWGIVDQPSVAETDEVIVRKWGIASAQIEVDDASVTHADIVGSQLKGLFYGRARILWKESGTGTKWAKLALGESCEIIHGAVVAEILSGSEGSLSVYKWNRTATTHIETISNDSGVALREGQWITAVWCDNDRKWRPVSSGAAFEVNCIDRPWVAGDIPVKAAPQLDGKTHFFTALSGFDKTLRQKIVHDPLAVDPTKCQEFAKWVPDTDSGGGGGAGSSFCELLAEEAEEWSPPLDHDKYYMPVVFWSGGGWSCDFVPIAELCEC